MVGTRPQTGAGKVLWHFTMSLDGFVAGPNHSMEWMTGITFRPGLVGKYVETTGAVLAGRDGWDSAIGEHRPYGGAWQGPIFVLTHHPEDAAPADGGHVPELRPGRGGEDRAARSRLCSGKQLMEVGLSIGRAAECRSDRRRG